MRAAVIEPSDDAPVRGAVFLARYRDLPAHAESALAENDRAELQRVSGQAHLNVMSVCARFVNHTVAQSGTKLGFAARTGG